MIEILDKILKLASAYAESESELLKSVSVGSRHDHPESVKEGKGREDVIALIQCFYMLEKLYVEISEIHRRDGRFGLRRRRLSTRRLGIHALSAGL